MLPAVSWRYYQQVHRKMSIRARMQLNRTFGVTPGCIPIQRKVTNALSGGLNVLGKPLSCTGEYEGLRLGRICKDATTLRLLCRKVCTKVAKIQHSKKKLHRVKKLCYNSG